jgi:hypothetical protein
MTESKYPIGDRIVLPPEILATIAEIEKILGYECNRTEYERIDGLLKLVFGSLMHHQLVYENLKLDLQTTIRLLEITEVKHGQNPLTHAQRDAMQRVLRERLKVNLRGYDHKIKHPDHPWNKSDWDCIPF